MQAVGGAALTSHKTVETDAAAPVAEHRPARRVRSLWAFGLVVFVITAVDLAVKQYTVTVLEHGEPVRLLGGLLYLVHVRNSGAAFSLGEGYTFIFPIIAIVVIGLILWVARRLASVPWAIALGLVLGGALGNLGDRIFRAPGPFVGHVVDMFSLFDDHGGVFAVFNVADSALSVGVVLAVLLEFTGRRRDGTRASRAERAGAGTPEEDREHGG